MLAITVQASDPNRVRKYLADHGYSNAVNGVDFSLRNDMDEKGTYIEWWVYTNKIPKIADCPKDKEADKWADLIDNPVEEIPITVEKPKKPRKEFNVSKNPNDYKYKLTGNIGQEATKEKEKEKKEKKEKDKGK